MATTYTENYHLGKQEDHSDRFNMKVITDNMDIIDSVLKSLDDRTGAGTAIENGSDLNDLSGVGIYTIDADSTVSSVPESVAAVVISVCGVIQIFIPDSFNGTYYVRLIGASWYKFEGTEVT